MQPSPEFPRSDLALLHAALTARRSVPRSAGEPVVLALAGGGGALLRQPDRRRLVSLVDGTEASRRGAVVRMLMRRQARRSALLLVPDRDTGIRLAQTWRVDLARVRVLDAGAEPVVVARRHLGRAGGEQRPWHAG